MTTEGAHHSTRLFFQGFSRHLRNIRDKGKDPNQAYRAQILLGQLQQFEKAVFEAMEAPTSPSFAEDMKDLLQVEDTQSLIQWIEKGGSPTFPETVFYCNEEGEWENCFGTRQIPDQIKIDSWVHRGLLGLLVSEQSDYAAFVFGQARLVMLFRDEEGYRGDQRLFAVFVARLLGVFVRKPLQIGGRKTKNYPGLIARDAVFLNTLAMIERAALRNVSILLEGESGSGKEVVADFIHSKSSRSKKPFVAVNCAAIPEGLIESELFGHEKGAFTGAYNRQIGRVEEADRGTLFLDEIGEMDLAVQAKMLRFLQLHEFHRVGGKQKITVDVRIVAATNRNLKKLVAEGKFRDDLYYRLSVMPFTVPALRERVMDILPLIHHFLKKYAKKFEMNLPEVDPKVLQLLTRYSFPGNVRELENIVQNILVVSQGKTIIPSHLPETILQLEAVPTLGPVSEKQPRQWHKNAIFSKSFHNLVRKKKKREAEPAAMKWHGEIPLNNDELKLAKKEIQNEAAREILHLEHRFLENLLERADGSMPVASEMGDINRTLLYKMLDRTKGLGKSDLEPQH